MLPYDPEKAAEIWKRVQSQPPAGPDPSDLLPLIAEEWTDAVTYLHLSRQFKGKEAAALRRLGEQEQAHAACLKGIYTLLTGQHPTLRTPPAPRENPQTLLRRCYGREMRCLAQYQARATDPEHGHVFSRLAAQEQEHCHILLQLLGGLKPKRQMNLQA